MTTISQEEHLMHYGILRKSGRYPWGSGGTAEQRSRDFLGFIDDLKKQGLSDVEISKGMALFTENGKEWSTTDFRAARSIANNQKKQADIGAAQKLHEKGYSNVKIGERMGINESTVRSLLAPGARDRADNLTSIADMLKGQIEKKEFLDIGKGVENHLGVSKEKLKTAVAMLKEEGYGVHYVKVKQLGTQHYTSMIVMAKPGVPYSIVAKNSDKIKGITDTFSEDGGRSFDVIKPPMSISSKRVGVIYKEDGGANSDGVMYVRPGVKDVSIGTNRYAQVRVAVDGTHYLKGMAIYKDGLPAGKDIMFNTNKSNTGNKLDAMKELNKTPDGKIDQENPFSASIKRQLTEKDAHGASILTSSMNIVNEEGNWESWSRNLSSQLLSKQSPTLAKEQLDLLFEKKKNEFDGIMALTNPTVKKKLLESFSDSVDRSSVHLEAHRLPRSSWHVILPINSMKEHEVYAPNFQNGEKIALIRYPHGGKFEIPELTVNNKNREARSIIGTTAPDAIGIHSKVAERLSGADFDGDAVLAIPNNSGKIKSASPLEGLRNFDPKATYPAFEGMPKMDAYTKGIQMGMVSNLITDMTIKGASTQELAQAVRHSMVVIDAEKHGLDWKRSAQENGIPALMKKYQDRSTGGASTLISRAESRKDVFDRKARSAGEGGPIDRTTGRKVFTPTGATTVDKSGRTVPVMIRSKKLVETDNAFTLSSGTKIEKVYAEHSNRLKDLANQARLAHLDITPIPMSRSAKQAYGEEVAHLNRKLNLAKMNAPLERQAQVLGNAQAKQRMASTPNLDFATKKKIEAQELEKARSRLQAKKQRIDISEREWAAIQAGAISNHKLEEILNNADLDKIKKLATPRDALKMTATKTQRAKSMITSGYTQAEIASALGVSLTTLKTHLGGE